MSDEPIPWESDVEDDPDDPKEVAIAETKLRDRCKAAGIECEDRQGLGGDTYLRIGIPNGRERRWLPLFSLSSMNDLLSIPFEEYSFLGGYEAICSYKQRSIEALIRGSGNSSAYAIRRRLQEDLGRESGTKHGSRTTLSVSSAVSVRSR